MPGRVRTIARRGLRAAAAVLGWAALGWAALGWAALGWLTALAGVPAATAGETVRVAVLADGTVSWEVDTIRHHGLAAERGVDLEVVELANPTATKIALQSGRVDVAVADWLWVSRQRRDGADLTFAPYSRAVGALMAGADSGIDGVDDLAGHRIGIVGGPLDKNWLLLRAYAMRQDLADPEATTEAVYGAPPLMSEQLRAGRVDAVLTYWHYAARLEAGGARRVIDVAEIIRGLGLSGDVPMLGYVFSAGWAERHPQAVEGFLAASRRAKEILRTRDAAWTRLRPLIKPDTDAELRQLRAGFRVGIPRAWGAAERESARKLFAILRELGGRELVGASDRLAPGTFWDGFRY
jgi:NitT/TauT family transport system substrate-binding protein